MELRVPRAVVERIRAHARETYPEECVGFLIGRNEGEDRVVTEARPAPNVSLGSRDVRYAIDNAMTRAVEAEFRSGSLRVVGFYHSHTRGAAVPSEEDRRKAWSYYAYAIVSVPDREPGELTAWFLDDETRTFAPARLVQT
jgi:proteasome lid subunit RPN8/RPN11